MLNKTKLIEAAIEYGQIDGYEERKRHIPGVNTTEMAKGYNDYVNEEFDKLVEDSEAIKDIIHGVWGSYEEFLDDQPFVLEFVITGKAEVNEDRSYVEYINPDDICDDCHELHDWCECHENDDDEDEYWND